jgi:hypothetical protein
VTRMDTIKHFVRSKVDLVPHLPTYLEARNHVCLSRVNVG